MISTQIVHNTPSILHIQPLPSRTHEYIPSIPQCHIPEPPLSSKQPSHDIALSDAPKSFEELLAASELPPPGPEYYAARRALWLTPTARARLPEQSSSRKRLEKLLNAPDAVDDDDVWDNGIEKVWKGLSAGGRLKRPLPMGLIVRRALLASHCNVIKLS